jgi:hypothetical protein
MSNLSDKRELLNSKKKLLDIKVKEANELSDKLSKGDISDAQVIDVKNNVDEIEISVKNLSKEVASLIKDINEEEKALDDISKSVIKNITIQQQNPADYLKYRKSLDDYARLLIETNGGKEFKKAWIENLHTKGISNPDILLPEALIRSISDALENSGSIYNTFTYIGGTVWKSALNTNISGETSRAHGYKSGTTKAEQVITIATKEIRPQYIYKYITVDQDIIRENRDTNALITYILSELPQRIVREMEMAAIIGDGRAASDTNKITSYESIVRTTADTYVSVQTKSSDIFADLVNMDATIKAPGMRYLVTSRQTLSSIKLLTNQGGLVFPIGSDIASALGYSAIFTPDWFPTATTAGTPVAVEYIGSAYKIVGDKTMDSYRNFQLQLNKNEFLMEIYSGGALDVPFSAGVLVIPT